MTETCHHADEHLTIDGHRIVCQNCGKAWIETPAYYTIGCTTLHPDDIQLVYTGEVSNIPIQSYATVGEGPK